MKVIVVEDQLLTREGIVRTLTHAGHEILDAVGDVPAMETAVALHLPDALILDVRLPPRSPTRG